MRFVDLTDTPFNFECTPLFDHDIYGNIFGYEFAIKNSDDNYYLHMSEDEIVQLRNNCKGIIDKLSQVQGA